MFLLRWRGPSPVHLGNQRYQKSQLVNLAIATSILKSMQLHRIPPGILPTKKYPVSIVLMCKVVLHFHSNSKGLSAILLISLMSFIMLCKVMTPVWLSNHTVGTFPCFLNLNNTSLKIIQIVVQTVIIKSKHFVFQTLTPCVSPKTWPTEIGFEQDTYENP